MIAVCPVECTYWIKMVISVWSQTFNSVHFLRRLVIFWWRIHSLSRLPSFLFQPFTFNSQFYQTCGLKKFHPFFIGCYWIFLEVCTSSCHNLSSYLSPLHFLVRLFLPFKACRNCLVTCDNFCDDNCCSVSDLFVSYHIIWSLCFV